MWAGSTRRARSWRNSARSRGRPGEVDEDAGGHAPLPPAGFAGTTAALTLLGLSWGLVNFGLLLWLPSELVAEGNSVALSSAIIAKSTLLAAPTVLVVAWLYSAWSTKGALLTMIGITAVGLGALLLRGTGLFPFLASPVFPIVLLIPGRIGRHLDPAALYV
jgi:putative MFS transporter